MIFNKEKLRWRKSPARLSSGTSSGTSARGTSPHLHESCFMFTIGVASDLVSLFGSSRRLHSRTSLLFSVGTPSSASTPPLGSRWPMVFFRLPTFAEVRPLFEKSTSSATFSIFGLAINVRNVLFGISGNLSLMHDE